MGLPRIIGITGYARHGKDTVANVLTRELGYNRVALADKMKELLLRLDPIVVATWAAEGGGTKRRLRELVAAGDWEGAKEVPEVRRLLQVFGTEVGRQGLGEDVWIEALAKSTKGFYGSDRRIVIPDIRFINEAQFIKRVGGEVWRVVRYDIVPDEAQGARQVPFDNGLGANGLHASEREIMAIRVDETLVNDGPKAKLQDTTIRLARFKLALQVARDENRPALDALAER